MSDENLELRLKLWNHLAQNGNLACSDAWYATDKQMQGWCDISISELNDKNSNASKEIEQINEFMDDDGWDASYRHFLMVFDLGCGTGHKAVEVLQHISGDSIAYYVPYDVSKSLINIASHTVAKELSAERDFCELSLSFSTFLRNASAHRFTECIDYLRKFNELPDALKNWLDDPVIKGSPMFKGISGLSEILDSSKQKATRLETDISKFWERAKTKTPSDLQEMLVRLWREYKPDLAETIAPNLAKIKSQLAFKMPDEQSHTLRDFAVYVCDVQPLKEIFADIRLLNSKRVSFKSQYDWPPTGIDSLVLINQGLNGDFFQNHSVEIAYLRSNAKAILKHISSKIKLDRTSWDFEMHTLPSKLKPRGLVMLLGQTLGNFVPEQQKQLVQDLYLAMQPDDYLLLGVELRPSKESPSYASHMDQLVQKYQSKGADDFMKEATHLIGIPDSSIGNLKARFNEANNTIEMFYQVQESGLTVPHPSDPARNVYFRPGAEIIAAISYKFDRKELHDLVKDARFEIKYFPDRTDYVLLVARK